MITINNLISQFNELADADPRINAFGAGPKYGILEDIKYYPYLWIVNDVAHDIRYTEVNKYRAVEFNFIIRVGDKVNNQKNVYNAIGERSNNGLDISSDTFTILLDMINVISEGLFDPFLPGRLFFRNVSLIDDISVEPFFHEDSGDVNGHEAQITLRAVIDNTCFSPITDIY